MKNIEDVNLYTFYANRQVSPTPAHFIRTNVKVNVDTFICLQELTTGRYSFCRLSDMSRDMYGDEYLAFEDSSDALFYELKYG
jgi:hypothetical protein